MIILKENFEENEKFKIRKMTKNSWRNDAEPSSTFHSVPEHSGRMF